MHKLIIYIDIDDICANLMETWLRYYNTDYNDILTPHDIMDWNISKFVKPECGNKIFDYLKNPDIYDTVSPSFGALNGVNKLRELGHRVIFLTAFIPEIAGRKYKWLKENKFNPERNDYIESLDKSLMLGDYLFDDRYENVVNFKGVGVLRKRPWNSKYVYSPSVDEWDEFVNLIEAWN